MTGQLTVRLLGAWTQIGKGVVNEVAGLLGGKPIRTPVGVGTLHRQSL